MTIGGTFIFTRVTASYAVADNGLLISSAISALSTAAYRSDRR